MPTQAVRDDYARWLATPPIGGMLVETLELRGAALTAPIFLCNRSDKPLQAADEMGVWHTFQPVAFAIDRPALRGSTEFMLNARIDAMDGSIFRAMTTLDNDALLHPIYAALRVYVDPIMLDRPVWRQPIRARVEEAKVSLDVVDLTLVGGRLPNKRAGTIYSMDRFIGTRPF
jgi:hypothetical protein